MTSTHLLLGFLLALLLFCTTPLVSAEQTLPQAVERVERETKGKVLATEIVYVGKQKMYRIKVLTPSGQVRVIQVAANSN